MPCKANPDVQRTFLKDTLLPLIEKAKVETVELFFLDASHFVMGAFSGRVWSVVRKWVKTSSGRQRFNVLGALHFATKKVESVTNTTYITSTQVIEMLEKLALQYAGKPIYIVLDNAKYHHCNVVKAAALRLNIELVFLPTYSPNLNLIERVWKLVKSRVLNSAYYETFNNFCFGIQNCVDTLHTNLSVEMSSLITHKIHIVNKGDIIG